MIFPFQLASGRSTDARTAADSPYENDWNGDLDSENLALHIYLGENAQQDSAGFLTSSNGRAEFDIVCDPSWFGQAQPNEVTFGTDNYSVDQTLYPNYSAEQEFFPGGSVECRLYDETRTHYIGASINLFGKANMPENPNGFLSVMFYAPELQGDGTVNADPYQHDPSQAFPVATLTLFNSSGYQETLELAGDVIAGYKDRYDGQGWRNTFVVRLGVDRLLNTGYVFDARTFSGYSYEIPLPSGFSSLKTFATLFIDSTGDESPKVPRSVISRRTAVYNWGHVKNPGTALLPEYRGDTNQPANGSVFWRNNVATGVNWLNEQSVSAETLSAMRHTTGKYGFFGLDSGKHFDALPFETSSIELQLTSQSFILNSDNLQKNVASYTFQDAVLLSGFYETTIPRTVWIAFLSKRPSNSQVYLLIYMRLYPRLTSAILYDRFSDFVFQADVNELQANGQDLFGNGSYVLRTV